MAMVQRLRARFQVSADLLLPPPKKVASLSLDKASRGLTRRRAAPCPRYVFA